MSQQSRNIASIESPVLLESPSRSLRVDAGYFYNSHPGKSASAIAKDVMNTLKNSGVTTVYIYAYSSVYGAFYPTNYPDTTVESGYGVQDIFGHLATEAKNLGLKSIAILPLNDFKTAWQNHSSWRMKQTAGADYKPHPDLYLVSPSSNEFKSWYAGFVLDLLERYPTIDGVEVAEPIVDYGWTGVSDQNPEALTAFSQQYPSAAIGSDDWFDFRSRELTKLISIFNNVVHSYRGKETHLVHTWVANPDGHLMNPEEIRRGNGFDFISVSKLSGEFKTDVLNSEFIWQQWAGEYGTSVFNPEWITSVGEEFKSTMKLAEAQSELQIHVEITPFQGTSQTVNPSLSEFGRTLNAAKKLNLGISVYDYNQIRSVNGFSALANWR